MLEIFQFFSKTKKSYLDNILNQIFYIFQTFLAFVNQDLKTSQSLAKKKKGIEIIKEIQFLKKQKILIKNHFSIFVKFKL